MSGAASGPARGVGSTAALVRAPPPYGTQNSGGPSSSMQVVSGVVRCSDQGGVTALPAEAHLTLRW